MRTSVAATVLVPVLASVFVDLVPFCSLVFTSVLVIVLVDLILLLLTLLLLLFLFSVDF